MLSRSLIKLARTQLVKGCKVPLPVFTRSLREFTSSKLLLNPEAGNDKKSPLYNFRTVASLSKTPILPGLAGMEGSKSVWSRLFGNVLWIVILGALLFNLGPKGLSTSMTSKPKVADQEKIKERLADVIGCDEVLDDLRELIEFLKYPEKYKEIGASIPRGVLLSGPPGTGKTLSARAIAGEAGVKFYWTSAAEFEEMYVGVGAKRVRELFAEARKNSPAVIFIDELDALENRKNGAMNNGATRATINTLLVEMDGFSPSENILVIGATNFPENLDEALVRPGRFDRKLTLSPPDKKARQQLFEFYLSKVRVADKIDTTRLASNMIGATGADIKTIVNNAAIRAAKFDRKEVVMNDLEETKENWQLGLANSSREYSPLQYERTAYHEGGHALVALLTEGANAVYKATILPRGNALGYVSFTNDDETDSYSVTYKQYLARLDTAMGGRVAEELIYGVDNITSGASEDLKQATRIARMMVTQFGYSDKIGKLSIHERETISEDVRKQVDDEVKKIIDTAYIRAKNLLINNKTQLDRVAKGLIKYETVSSEELKILMEGKTLNRDV